MVLEVLEVVLKVLEVFLEVSLVLKPHFSNPKGSRNGFPFRILKDRLRR